LGKVSMLIGRNLQDGRGSGPERLTDRPPRAFCCGELPPANRWHSRRCIAVISRGSRGFLERVVRRPTRGRRGAERRDVGGLAQSRQLQRPVEGVHLDFSSRVTARRLRRSVGSTNQWSPTIGIFESTLPGPEDTLMQKQRWALLLQQIGRMSHRAADGDGGGVGGGGGMVCLWCLLCCCSPSFFGCLPFIPCFFFCCFICSFLVLFYFLFVIVAGYLYLFPPFLFFVPLWPLFSLLFFLSLGGPN